MAEKTKRPVEFLLVRCEIGGMPAKVLPKSRNVGCLELIWPRAGIARKSGAREFVFKKGVADFTAEDWTRRCVFREEVDGHCGVAVSITEPVSVQQIRRFLRLTAKYALKMEADFMEKALVGHADIASSPVDALAQMLGEKDTPKTIAQGVVDIAELPPAGEEREIAVPLFRTRLRKSPCGTMTLLLR
ncbi:MAG: hypothetical protein ACI4Q3_03695 [Kiritimatiellia bacterium]